MPLIRDLIVNQANTWAGKIYLGANGMVGADDLVTIYKTTGKSGHSILLSGMWSPIIEKGVRQGLWIRKQPLPPDMLPGHINQESVHKYCTAIEEGEGVHGPVAWCGIFAAFVLKRTGLAAHWENQKIDCANYVRWGGGIKGTPDNWKDLIDRGDICCLDTKPGAGNNHHVIVTNVPKGSNNVDTVEGNLSSPRQSVQALTGKRSRTDIYTLYKLKDETVKEVTVNGQTISLQT